MLAPRHESRVSKAVWIDESWLWEEYRAQGRERERQRTKARKVGKGLNKELLGLRHSPDGSLSWFTVTEAGRGAARLKAKFDTFTLLEEDLFRF